MARPPEFDHNSMSMYDNVDQKKVQKESPRMRQLRQRLEANNSGVEVSSVGGGFAAAKDTDRTSPELNTTEVKIDNRSRRQAFVQDLDQDLHSEVVMHSKNLASNLSDLAMTSSRLQAAEEVETSNLLGGKTTVETTILASKNEPLKQAFRNLDPNLSLAEKVEILLPHVDEGSDLRDALLNLSYGSAFDVLKKGNVSELSSNNLINLIRNSENSQLTEVLANVNPESSFFDLVSELVGHLDQDQDSSIMQELQGISKGSQFSRGRHNDIDDIPNIADDGAELSQEQFQEYVQSTLDMSNKSVELFNFMLETFGEIEPLIFKEIALLHSRNSAAVGDYGYRRERDSWVTKISLPFQSMDSYPPEDANYFYQPQTKEEFELWKEMNIKVQENATQLNQIILEQGIGAGLPEDFASYTKEDFKSFEELKDFVSTLTDNAGDFKNAMEGAGLFIDANKQSPEYKNVQETLGHLSSIFAEIIEDGAVNGEPLPNFWNLGTSRNSIISFNSSLERLSDGGRFSSAVDFVNVNAGEINSNSDAKFVKLLDNLDYALFAEASPEKTVSYISYSLLAGNYPYEQTSQRAATLAQNLAKAIEETGDGPLQYVFKNLELESGPSMYQITETLLEDSLELHKYPEAYDALYDAMLFFGERQAIGVESGFDDYWTWDLQSFSEGAETFSSGLREHQEYMIEKFPQTIADSLENPVSSFYRSYADQIVTMYDEGFAKNGRSIEVPFSFLADLGYGQDVRVNNFADISIFHSVNVQIQKDVQAVYSQMVEKGMGLLSEAITSSERTVESSNEQRLESLDELMSSYLAFETLLYPDDAVYSSISGDEWDSMIEVFWAGRDQISSEIVHFNDPLVKGSLSSPEKEKINAVMAAFNDRDYPEIPETEVDFIRAFNIDEYHANQYVDMLNDVYRYQLDQAIGMWDGFIPDAANAEDLSVQLKNEVVDTESYGLLVAFTDIKVEMSIYEASASLLDELSEDSPVRDIISQTLDLYSEYEIDGLAERIQAKDSDLDADGFESLARDIKRYFQNYVSNYLFLEEYFPGKLPDQHPLDLIDKYLEGFIQEPSFYDTNSFNFYNPKNDEVTTFVGSEGVWEHLNQLYYAMSDSRFPIESELAEIARRKSPLTQDKN